MSWNLHDIDKAVFIFLNRDHTEMLDNIMYSARNLLFWIPLILLCVFMLQDYKRSKSAPHSMVKIIMICSLLVIQIVLCEYILPYLIDPMAVMQRPIYNSEIATSVNLGNFTFSTRAVIFSSQVCATAAIAAFLIVLSDTARWLKTVLVVWALLLCYNRIYIGAQYPSTLLISICLGAGVGLLAYRYYYYLKDSLLAI